MPKLRLSYSRDGLTPTEYTYNYLPDVTFVDPWNLGWTRSDTNNVVDEASTSTYAGQRGLAKHIKITSPSNVNAEASASVVFPQDTAPESNVLVFAVDVYRNRVNPGTAYIDIAATLGGSVVSQQYVPINGTDEVQTVRAYLFLPAPSAYDSVRVRIVSRSNATGQAATVRAWAPMVTTARVGSLGSNLLPNSTWEEVVNGAPRYWNLTGVGSSVRVGEKYRYLDRTLVLFSAMNSVTGTIRTNDIAVKPNAEYQLSALLGLSGTDAYANAWVDWYTAGGVFIKATYMPTTSFQPDYALGPEKRTARRGVIKAPDTAAFARVSFANSSPNSDQSYLYVDRPEFREVYEYTAPEFFCGDTITPFHQHQWVPRIGRTISRRDNLYDTLSLSAMSDDRSAGIEAQAGGGGWGLSPVTLSFFEGAKGTSRFRGERYQTRDTDVPMHLYGLERADLLETTQKLTRAVTAKKLYLHADYTAQERANTNLPRSHWLEVRRAGGGDVNQGEDTDGQTFLKTVMTFRSGEPRWTRSDSVATRTPGAVGTVTMTVNNPGDAEVYPKIKVVGPCYYPIITGPDGTAIAWKGQLGADEYLLIDCARGTVVDQSGASRYSELTVAPRFFSLAPGVNTITINRQASVSAFARNYHTAPQANITVPGSLAGAPRSESVSGLTVGKTYTASITIEPAALTCDPAYPIRVLSPSGTSAVWVQKSHTGAGTFTAASTFTANATTMPMWQVYGGRATDGQWRNETITARYVGESATPFDGSTPDTRYVDYSWAGAANASQSIATLLPAATIATSSCTVTFNPCDWLVI